MVKYVCKKCNKEFAKKCDYVYVSNNIPMNVSKEEFLLNLAMYNGNKNGYMKIVGGIPYGTINMTQFEGMLNHSNISN